MPPMGIAALAPADPDVFPRLTSESPREKAEIVEWALTLFQDAATRTPTRYELRYTYGFTAPNHPGIGEANVSGSSVSYTIKPLATGPSVFGVFEGRTPCQGIVRELQRPADEGCQKLKWRVTLFQDPSTGAPTT